MASPLDGLKFQHGQVSGRKPIPHNPTVWERGAIPMTSADPTATGSGWYFPQDRLRQLENQYQASPGRRPGGSGPTGLMSGDARGWSNMLNEQQEFMNLAAAANKKPRPDVQFRGYPARQATSSTAGEANVPFSLGGSAMPAKDPAAESPYKVYKRGQQNPAVAGLKGVR